MASASRDGTPGPRKKSARGQNTGKTTRKAGAKGAGAKGAAKRNPQVAGGSTKKTHRKGSSKPDVTSGKVRLNNAKPARHQNVDVQAAESGATYVSDGVRLQKVLAAAGVASRRGAEELIAAGRVEVDGEIVTEQGLRIDPDTAVIRVDGARVIIDEDKQYLALNKPKGWQSTMSDDQGRPCVGDIVAERVMAGQRLFHVGRLDADTEGLLLLTNDGELAHRLMHPSYEIPKTYLATLRGEVPRSLGRVLKGGVELEDGPVSVDSFTPVEVHEGQSLVRITLHEGRNRIVRRMMEEVGFPVTALVRTHVGAVALGEQRPGSLRVLGKNEVGALYKAVGL
ncbi:pseudouridine synthase [Gordonia sp. Z-3]|jgi:23S rRNA pseudouridine2605 synthase|uniref:Pseudouridine synthase n=2 Tax=Gordonia TaxID=2053 RepID=A0A9X3D3G1_9ACTN|nr:MULTISPECIES: pseudouridine synthase [Gordonia]MAU84964.1 pseudouridine synthase [Gordonia sp. (in: high G+C Gram-positive bacteria)]MCF3939543.1 rRNA pseudouridine synthase [Gordonia tangerina]MCX2964353.1 pseudouridine synthase [Gordonia aquimaris]MED5801954.1 pseudouridine synthase [Gordonia sp. Z-3]